jgi:hypothetical protein
MNVASMIELAKLQWQRLLAVVSQELVVAQRV